MAAVLAPGLYYETFDAGSPAVHPLRTDITGFVGLAPKGPVNVPVAVESWRQFVSWFGGLVPFAFLGYAVKGFFDNGGKRAWIVRCASLDFPLPATSATADVADASGKPAWRLSATSPGTWGNTVSVTVRERIGGTATSQPDGGAVRWSKVDSVTSFASGDLVRLSQGSNMAWRTVAAVDSATGIVHWVNPDSSQRKDYEAAIDRNLDGTPTHFDPDVPLLLESVTYALIVEVDREVVSVLDGLSTVPGTPLYGPDILRGIEIDEVTGGVACGNKPPMAVTLADLRTDASAFSLGLDVGTGLKVTLSGGLDGLQQLAVGDLTGDDDGRGVNALEAVTEVGLLCCPDAQPRSVPGPSRAPLVPCTPDPCWDPPLPAAESIEATSMEVPPSFSDRDLFLVQSSLVDQAEHLCDRIAILDAPYSASVSDVQGTQACLAWRQQFDSEYAAAYYPWISVTDPGQGTVNATKVGTRALPPCGHVTGAIASTDLAHGVYRAPANVALDWALSPLVTVGSERHGLLNEYGVNVLRTSPGGDLKVMGARTLSSDTDWKFLNVRRLMSMIEKALDIAFQWAVFEPNDYFTRARLVMAATGLLMSLHEAGALVGETPAESFYIKCDLDNNPTSARENGQLIMEIGVAPTVPYEFVVLKVGRLDDSFEVTSSGRSNTGAGASSSC